MKISKLLIPSNKLNFIIETKLNNKMIIFSLLNVVNLILLFDFSTFIVKIDITFTNISIFIGNTELPHFFLNFFCGFINISVLFFWLRTVIDIIL